MQEIVLKILGDVLNENYDSNINFQFKFTIETASSVGTTIKNTIDETMILYFMGFFGFYLVLVVLMSLWDFIRHVSNVGGKNHNDVKYIASDSHQRLMLIKEQSKQNLKMKLGVKPKYIDSEIE